MNAETFMRLTKDDIQTARRILKEHNIKGTVKMGSNKFYFMVRLKNQEDIYPLITALLKQGYFGRGGYYGSMHIHSQSHSFYKVGQKELASYAQTAINFLNLVKSNPEFMQAKWAE